MLLPPHTTDPYYYIDGWQDHTEYMAFSGTSSELDSIVEKRAGMKLSHFQQWQGDVSALKCLRPEPGDMGKKYRTMLYDIDRVNTGLFATGGTEMKGWYLLYDRENGRVYYSEWNS